eukprot:GFUD01017608.1.p1 GENE.GFUD01017608.1~~GFUD01017608.1.p1  ORF type:complete len:533 (+),score=180.88 GFUD01017608.1:197-1600(+)
MNKKASPAPTKKVIKDNSSPPKKPKKDIVAPTIIKSVKPCDYSEWDKFDADAACEEVEKSVSEEEDGYTSEEEELENERLMVEAVAEKDRGNEWFKNGNFDKAIERYTRGMTLDPLNAVLPANRAMALLKQGRFGAAETDCTLALSIDTTYIKAFQRRASARIGLDKLDLAIQDYDEVLRLEPKNKAAQTERAKLVQKLAEKSDESKDDNNYVKPSFNKFEDKMKGALAKNEPKTVSKIEKLEVAETKVYSKSVGLSQVENSTSVEGLVLPIQKPVHTRSQKPLKRIEITETSSGTSRDEKSPPVRKDAVKDVAAKKEATKSKGFTKKIEREISADLSKVEIVNTIPPVPSTSSKFFTDWKSMKTIVNRAKYLQQFKAADYTTVFKSSLDGVVFTELVMVLNHLVQRGVMPEIVVNQLQGLSGLPRVSAIAMFMSKQDQDRLRYVIGELEIANPDDKLRWEKVFSLN